MTDKEKILKLETENKQFKKEIFILKLKLSVEYEENEGLKRTISDDN